MVLPISLSLYLYSLYQDKVQKAFDENNKVLSQKDVEALLLQEDKQKTLRIFRSAIVDHVNVEGLPYYLSYPVNGIFCHDTFKRAVIADSIGNYTEHLQGEELSEAVLILDHLINPRTERGYVQILAWNSLGRIGMRFPNLIENKKEKVKDAFNYSTASSLGALMFLDRMLETSQQELARCLIIEGMRSAKYSEPKALYSYYVYKSTCFDNPLEENLKTGYDIKCFLSSIQQNYSFNQDDFNEGLKYVGIITGKQDPSFFIGTPHLDVAKRVVNLCGDYIAAIGAFFTRAYERKRGDNFDSWKLLTR